MELTYTAQNGSVARFEQPSYRAGPYQISGPVRGLGQPPVSGRYDKTPLQDGKSLRNIEIGSRVITFKCLIEGSDQNDWRSKRNTLRTILRPTFGREEPNVGTLAILLDSGVTRSIDCFVTGFGSRGNSVLKPGYSIEPISFNCPYPWFKDSSLEKQIVLVGPIGGFPFSEGVSQDGLYFPEGFGGNRPSAIIEINATGQIISYPTLSAVGQVSNLVINNLTTGESMAVDHVVPPGALLEIDSENKTVQFRLSGTLVNIFHKLSANQSNQFISLYPGDNVIVLQQDEIGTEWTISYSPTYVGI